MSTGIEGRQAAKDDGKRRPNHEDVMSPSDNVVGNARAKLQAVDAPPNSPRKLRPRKGLALALSGTVCFVLPAIILMNVDRVPDAAMGVALVLVPIGLFVGGTLGVVQLGELLSARQPKID
jgi:hypothetical protein